MKTLYLHIGTPKTGTTAIQVMCWENEEALARRGFSYPHLPYAYSKVNERRNGHFLVGHFFKEDGSGRDLKLEKKVLREGVSTVLGQLDSVDNVILSDENLWTHFAKHGISALEYLKERCDEAGVLLKIIVYLRSQDGLLTSWYKQQSKEMNRRYSNETPEGVYEGLRDAFQYYEVVSRLSDIVGKDNMIVRLFERSAFVNGDVVNDFFSLVGIGDISDFIVDENPAPNTSLNENVTEIIRSIKTIDPTDEFYRLLIKKAARFSSEVSDPEYKTTVFSDEEAAEFLHRFDESNGRLAREYLGKEDGILFRSQKGGNKWTLDNPYFFEELTNFLNFLEMHELGKRQELKDLVAERSNEYKEMESALEKRIRALESSFPQRVSRKLKLDRLAKKRTKK